MSRLLLLLLALLPAVLLPGAALAGPRIAIADLANHTGDSAYDPAGPGVAALLVTRFSRTDAVTVVERQQLQAVLAELKLSESGLVDEASAIQAGRLLGADYMVLGSIFSVKLPTLSVSLRVVDTQTGEVALARDVVGEVGDNGEDFFLLVDQLAGDIVEGLGVDLSARDRVELSQVDVRELEALLAYGRKLTAPPREHPKALWRDKAKDMMSEDQRRLFTVRNNEGTIFGAEAFARTIGDTETVQEIQHRRDQARRRANGLAGATWGLLGAGSAGMLMGLVDRDHAATWLVGGGIVAGSSLVTAPMAGAARYRQFQADQLGRYYSPEEADALIADHNTALPPVE